MAYMVHGLLKKTWVASVGGAIRGSDPRGVRVARLGNTIHN